MSSGKLADAIDIHSHFVPRDFPAYAGTHLTPRWPSMETICGCAHRSMVIDGGRFRDFDPIAWDVSARIEWNEAFGIARQVISPLPELLSYWLAPEDAGSLCRFVNEGIGEMAARSGGRLLAMGGLPMQDVDLAVMELRRLMESGAFCGVELGTNVAGASIGDPRFHPVLEAAEALGAAIFIHPERPVGKDRLIGPGVMGNLVAHPCDTALAVASLITGGGLRRFPNLRIAVAHGGGAFAGVLSRLEYGWRTIPSVRDLSEESPSAVARRLFWDNLVYDAPMTDFLIQRFGSSQICLGTDLPAAVDEGVPFATISHLDADVQQDIVRENPRRFLDLDRVTAKIS